MTSTPITAPAPLLAARDLTAVLAGDAGDVRVLDGAALNVASGEVVDVTGPSGSGKTTLLRSLAWLLPGASGVLALGGEAAEQIGPQRWRTRVALLPQKPATFAGSVRENLLLPWRLKSRAHATAPDERALSAALAEVGLGDIALDRDVARLSVGQQARVVLLRVLLTEPSVLLLDEPDAALDPASAASVAALTRAFAERGGAVVRVRHREGDGVASRRLQLSHGVLEEVGA